MIIFDAKNKDLATALLVAEAVSPDKSKYNLNVLYIKGNTMYASDGSRLHFAPLTGDYPDGAYDIIKKAKKELILNPAAETTLGMMPDFARTIPKDQDAPIKLGHGKYIDYGITVKAMAEDRYLNYDFFLAAQAEFVHINPDRNGPIKFTGAITAVIMPMRDRGIALQSRRS
jgi:hypothetical protein